jgi:NADPH:quinone reductase-like Zn-dependent oxidoreductase
MDPVGNIPFSRAKGSLTANGRLLAIVAGLSDMLLIPWIHLTGKRKVMTGSAPERAGDLRFLAELAAAGQCEPVIDRTYAFEEMIEAHRLVDSGRKRGNVVVEVVKGD